jgi:hypothetical protein
VVKEFPLEGERIQKLFIERLQNIGILKDPDIVCHLTIHSSKSIGPKYELIYTPDNLIVYPEWESSAKAIRKKAEEIAE